MPESRKDPFKHPNVFLDRVGNYLSAKRYQEREKLTKTKGPLYPESSPEIRGIEQARSIVWRARDEIQQEISEIRVVCYPHIQNRKIRILGSPPRGKCKICGRIMPLSEMANPSHSP